MLWDGWNMMQWGGMKRIWFDEMDGIWNNEVGLNGTWCYEMNRDGALQWKDMEQQ